MEKKGYREPIKASLEEILERNAQINEIKERFDKLKEDIAKSNNPDDLAKVKSEFKEYLESLDSAYEVRISPMLDIEAHANPSIYAIESIFDLEADQITDCFESAVDAFNARMNQKLRSYCEINSGKRRASAMSIRARKYNVELHEYEDILLPDECRTYEVDMEKMVPCAQCGRLHKYGDMYTSREVHTAYGFGFAVCRECYDDEMDRFLAEHPPFKEN